MPDKNKNNKLTDFLRYRKGEMTGEERNSFERELQKDSFAEEAAEGFALISSGDVSKDIVHLHKQLKTRVARKPRFIYFRIAASVAVLMMISTIFIIVERNKPGKYPSETTLLTEPLEITVNQPITEPIVKDKVSEKPAMIAAQKSDKSAERQIRTETGKAAKMVEDVNIAVARTTDAIVEKKIKAVDEFVVSEHVEAPLAIMAREKPSGGIRIKGKVLSSEDNMPVPGANVLIKGTSTGVVTDIEGNFDITVPDSDNRTLVASFTGMESKEFETKADSQLLVSLDPSVSDLSEVVVVGYDANKSRNAEISGTAYRVKSDQSGYSPPQPIYGKENFFKYIEDNIQKPVTPASGQRSVVVVSFVIQTNGIIDTIKVIRSPGNEFSAEAIRLVRQGPAWKPAEKNGKIIEDEIRLRIVFR